MQIQEGDWINYVKIGFEECICQLYLRTYKGKTLLGHGSIEPLEKKE